MMGKEFSAADRAIRNPMEQSNAKDTVTLEIDSLVYGPQGLGRKDGRVIMVPRTAPGDTINARIVAAKDRFASGALLEVVRPSPARRTPPCPYVPECGGCPWQHVRYPAQLQAKQKNVEDALRRIGKLDGFELRPIIASPMEYGYRRRVRLQSDGRKQLGFFRAESHDLVGVESCLIAADEINALLAPVRTWIETVPCRVEHVEIVAGDKPGELVLVVKSPDALGREGEAAALQLLKREPRIRGVIMAGADGRRAHGGTDISICTEEGVTLCVSADVFTQVNPAGNRLMVRELLAAAAFDDRDRVLELFSGAGNFTLSIARRAREIVAVEGDRPAVEAGRQNARRHGLANIHWIADHVPAAVARLAAKRATFSKIVLDPPRSGAKGIESRLVSLGAERIVYLSCSPATLARDLAALAKHGYKLMRVQPIDLFPQTFHVETLALLSR